MGTEREQQLTMHGLRSAAGFVQTKVAAQLTSRYVPHITFVLDEGVKKSIEIARLIREENDQLAADAHAAGKLNEIEEPAEQSGPAEGPVDRPG